MLAESMAISLGVLLIAAVARVAERQTTTRLLAVLAAAAWGLTRDVDGLFLLVVACAWFAFAPRRPVMRLAPAGLAAIALIAIVSAATSGRSAVSFDDVIGARVLTNPDQRAFFSSHDMPAAVQRLRGRLGRS